MSEPSDPREPLARIVHQVRLDHEAERAAAEGRATFLLGAYEDRSEHQRELDMRIGAAVAAAAAAGAEAKLAAIADLTDPGAIPESVVNAALMYDVRNRGFGRWDAVPPAQVRRLIAGAVLAIIGAEEEGHDAP